MDNSPCTIWYHCGTIKEMRYQKVIIHGNSLAVVIPAAVCRELQIKRGDMVRLVIFEQEIEDGEANSFYLRIEPVLDIDTGVEKKIHG